MSKVSAAAAAATGTIFIARSSATARCVPLTLSLALQLWAAFLAPMQVLYLSELRSKVSQGCVFHCLQGRLEHKCIDATL